MLIGDLKLGCVVLPAVMMRRSSGFTHDYAGLSCSAFFSSYYRVYGVKSFPEKFDKMGKLVRKFCPELAKFPDKYIYAPHTAPIDVQKKAGCIIGTDYPKPILDDKLEKERCISRIKVAYKKGYHGDHEAVLSGRAAAELEDAHDKGSENADRTADGGDVGEGVGGGPAGSGRGRGREGAQADQRSRSDELGTRKSKRAGGAQNAGGSSKRRKTDRKVEEFFSKK